MNLEKLAVGMEIKNYKELCALLGEKVKDGNAKKAQIKEWERHFKYHKQGYKFIIDEIYSTTKKKQSNKRNNVYGDMVQLLIIDSLIDTEEKHISVSKSKLFEMLGFVNPNYRGCKGDIEKFSKWLKMDIRLIHEFYNLHDSNFRSTIERALKSLEDERLIMVERICKVKHKDNAEHVRATNSEMELILNVEKDVLEELGFNKLSEARKSSKWQEFKHKSNKAIRAESNIQYYYMAYDISINQRYLERAKERLIDSINSHEDRDEMMDNMNAVVRKNIVKNAKKRQVNEIAKPTANFGMRTDVKYIENTKKLSGLLVERGAKDITKVVSKVKIAK